MIDEPQPTIEVLVGHLRDSLSQVVWLVIADNGNKCALVYWPGVKGQQASDFDNTKSSLNVNGNRERPWHRKDVPADSLDAFVEFACVRSGDGDQLKAGDTYDTGTATVFYWANAGDTMVAHFREPGDASLDIR